LQHPFLGSENSVGLHDLTEFFFDHSAGHLETAFALPTSDLALTGATQQALNGVAQPVSQKIKNIIKELLTTIRYG
jgi:hypothetical protein